MDLQEEVPIAAHELASELLRHILDGHHPGIQVALHAVELGHEVPVELGLEIGERRLRRLPVGGGELTEHGRGLLAEGHEVLGQLVARLGRHHVEPPLDVGERLTEAVEVHRARAADPDRRQQRREALHDGDLLRLIVRDDVQDRVHPGDRGQALEGLLLLPELVEGGRRGEGVEARAAGVGQDAPLPDDGLGALGLQVQEVVIEADRGQRPDRERGGDRHDHEDGRGIAGELVEHGDTRRLFTSPRQKLTEDYITGRFG